MPYRSRFLVAVAAALVLHPLQLHGQGASAPEDFFPLQPTRSSMQLAAASLDAILAQRLADKPAAQQTWSRATEDNARIGAQSARANFNGMTAAMQRMLADTAAWAEPAVNGDLKLDFSMLRDVEARYEEVNAETGRRREALTRMSFALTPDGEKMFHLDESGEIFLEQKKAWAYRSSIQYEPASSLFYQTEETIPVSPGTPPVYEAAALVGDNVFSAPMPPKRRFETKVAPGAVYPTMLGLVITAMVGELPPSFTIWIVNDQGVVVPAEIKVVGEMMVEEPVGPAGGTCAGATVTGQPRRAVELQVSAGSFSHTRVVLADAPHLKVSEGLKCRVVR